MQIDEHITKTELQALLKLHRNTVGRLLAEGRFPGAFRAGGRWRIPVSDVEHYIQASQSGTGPATGGGGLGHDV